ncbi:MAG: hypothetical protein K0R38_6894 [Polyangiaceae bacterium]|jgi:hypothetical protein|nr:hypothetical protein [Polyangiaceae bacterium]
MALDATWFGTGVWQAQQADRLLTFFHEPLTTRSYAATCSLAGVPGAPLSDTLSLEAPLAAIALAATVPSRKDFVQAVWAQRQIPRLLIPRARPFSFVQAGTSSAAP